MKKVLMWSFGKDSTASGIVAKLNGWKIDRIVTCTPDPFKAEIELLGKFEDFMGVKIEVATGPTFEDFFYKRKTKGVNKGGIYGWPKLRQKACARFLKWHPQAEWAKQNPGYQAVVGIAADEVFRLTGVRKLNDVSFLALEGVTQEGARRLCEEYGLLNPLYHCVKRTGCVRCPKQLIGSLRRLPELEPEKFQWMLDHDDKSPVTFLPGRTFRDVCKKQGLL